jgi:hypothetical protein
MRSKSGVAVLLAGLMAALINNAACSRKTDAGKPSGLPPAASGGAGVTAPNGETERWRQAFERARAKAAEEDVQADAADELPDPRQTISGTIVLPAANRARVARGDVIFLAARRASGLQGPGSMLAVQKLVAGAFPMAFSISSHDAMIPGVPFEGRVSITARVDKDGEALTRLKGDVFGQVSNVEVGARHVIISLDTVQTEDRTLPGARGILAGEALPPGHP